MRVKNMTVPGIQNNNGFIARIKALRTAMLITSVCMLCIGGCSHDDIEFQGKEGAKLQALIYTRLLYDGKYGELWDNSTTRFKVYYGSVENFTAYPQFFLDELGKETQVIGDRVFSFQGYWAYEHAASFQNIEIPVSIEWVLDGDMKINWFEIRLLPDEVPTQFEDYRTKTDLRMPFDGEWMVLWGGRSTRDNYHAGEVSSQRFAYDFLITQNGLHFSGDGSRNEDHYCFGEPIFAPGAGVVTDSESNVPDSLPGEGNTDQPYGNYIIIDHENGEYSFLVHFRQGTVAVHAGDRVTAGTFLGECGNSGYADIPHLHYHIQNTADFDYRASGLPPQFQSYSADGEFVDRGEPTRWQLVQPQ